MGAEVKTISEMERIVVRLTPFLFSLLLSVGRTGKGELGIGVIDALALVARGSIAQDGSRNVGILLFQQGNGNAVRVRFIACSLTAQVEADLVVARLEDLFNALGDDSVSQLGGNAALQGVGIPGEGGVDDQCLCDISRQMGNVDEVRRLSRYPRRGERCSALGDNAISVKHLNEFAGVATHGADVGLQ